MTMWTVFDDVETGVVLDAHDQSDPVCGGGDALCGGCRDCLEQMAGESVVVHRDVADERLDEMMRERVQVEKE